MDHFQDFLKVLKAMEDEEVDYILIGGFAVILHGLPRFTMDMEFFIQMVEQNVHKLRKTLYSTFGDSDIMVRTSPRSTLKNSRLQLLHTHEYEISWQI